MLAHSPTFSFSSADRWVNCSGSVKLCLGEPDDDPTPESMEGDAVHWLALQTLLEFKEHDIETARFYLDTAVKTQAPNGLWITREMVDAAEPYLESVTAVVEDKSQLYIETQISAHLVDPELYGTPDCYYYDIKSNTIWIWDLKYGHGSVVAEGNYQLICGVLAVVETFTGLRNLNPRVEARIVQPRCYDGRGPIRKWTTTWDDMRGYINRIRNSITAYRANNTRCETGSYCKHCPGAYKCLSFLEAAANAVEVSNATVSIDMSDDQVAFEKFVIDRALERLQARAEVIDSQIESRIRKGNVVPGFGVEPKFSNSKWNVPDSQVMMIGDMLQVELRKPQTVATPGQAITELKRKKIDPAAIMPYHGKVPTGVKIVETDSTKAQQYFKQPGV